MTSLVLELQKDALNRSVATADLLRKALVVARKLKVSDLVEWLDFELNGYPDGAEVPKYRKLKGELRVHNPYHGWIPLMMASAEIAESLSTRGTPQSVSELERLANEDGATVYVRLPRAIEQRLMKAMEIPLEPAVIFSQIQIHGLIDKVRNTVLDWALGLEERGVTGEGMSFSPEEQRQAGSLTLNVGSLGSFVGSMHGSQVQQGTVDSTQTYSKALDFDAVAKIVAELRDRIEKAEMGAKEKAQVESDLACIETQLSAPKPNSRIVRESLQSTRTILEGVVSSAIFQGIVNAIAALGV